MRKGFVAIWAILTVCFALCLFTFAMPIYNREKVSGSSSAPVFLLAPFAVQVLWFAGGALYAARRKVREPVLGILFGFAVEGAALLILIVISALAHY